MSRTTQQTQQQIMENDAAVLAAEMFDHFCSATTMRQILGLYRNMCDTIGLRPGPLNEFYPKLKTKVKNWKAQALWKKFDARAAHRVYNKGTACNGTKVLVIGAGPCGLRTAIEAQLLGAKVVVVEKRDRISRNNVLHLWPFLITDLRNLGAKKFYGKFCAGAIDHISIRQLQCILLKVALLLGVEIHEGISFVKTLEPKDGCGWRAQVSPEDHAVSHYEFDVLMGADGKRNTLEGFKRKEFRGKLAIAITANFINKKTEAEARVEEISGVAFIFNQSFFKELYQTTGIDLENIVYYKDETHYFVMTAKKHSLLDKGVIIQDYADPAELLKPSNVNTERLSDYAQEAAAFSTKYQMPNVEFAVNHYGKPDVAMFDFTSMFAAENSSRIFVKKNYRLLQCLVGDSLLEPFWPTGSGCARGFLSSMDAAYAVKLFANHSNSLLAVLAQRESIYRLLAQTTPENLQRDIGAYTLDPASRYPNLNRSAVTVQQVKHLLDTDDPSLLEQIFMDTNVITLSIEQPVRRKRRTGDTIPLGTVLLRWIKSQLKGHEFSQTLTDVSQCFTIGEVLCALIHRYRPDLIDLNEIKTNTAEESNEKAFNIFEHELGIPRVMTAKESINLELVENKIWLNYLEQICEVFRGEIPHVKHPKLDFDELKEKSRNANIVDFSHLLKLSTKKAETPSQPIQAISTRRHHHQQPHHAEDREDRKARSLKKSTEHNIQASGPTDIPRRAKKRRTYDKSQNIEERTKRLAEIESNRYDRTNRRREQRRRQTENFLTSLHMLQANTFLRESDDSTAFDDYSLYVYRQSAPVFDDRVKELERKLLYPDRDRGILSAMPRGGLDDQFSDRIKSMEQRITGKHGIPVEKKPKDLLRAIGKIESNDWNVKEIEKKIELSKKTEVGKNREKVPKWSREQFLARQNKMSRPLDRQDTAEEKYKEIDTTIKALDKQLKDPVLFERGRNKVASIAGQFKKKDDSNSDEKPSPTKSNANANKVGLVFSAHGLSEVCHFCKQRVYLMEKITAEGLVLHRSCLKCYHCHTNLRLGGYAFDRDNPNGLFYCTQHYRLPAKSKPATKRPLPRASRTTETDGKTKPETQKLISDSTNNEIINMDFLNRGQTPERIEFENADMSDGEPSLDNVIDENEWTDRNFGTGTDASESDITSSTSESDDSDSDIFEEAIGSPLGAQTLQLATDWIGKQRYIEDSDDEDFYDTSEDDEADTQTEGEELARARELRMQEVKLRPPLCATNTDTETEAQSDSDSSNDVELNSATEISTDSEFDLDPISKNPPQIYIDDSYVKKPTKVQIKQGMIENRYGNRQYPTNNIIKEKLEKDIQLKFKPLVQVDPSVLNSNNTPFKNPRPGDYLLNKTPSTEGIASKKSLELKKRYLLGDPSVTGGIMKSGSTSILDSKLRNFHSNISECQKLLHPELPEISQTMQTFLRNSKLAENKRNNIDEKENIKIDGNCKITETINTALLESKIKNLSSKQTDVIDLTYSPPNDKQKSSPIIDIDAIEIPSSVIRKNQEFIENMAKSDVIDLTADTPVNDRSLEEQNQDFNTSVPDLIKSSNLSERTKNTIDQMFEENLNKVEDQIDENEPRPRSPAQETSIAVPILSWENKSLLKNKDGIESDSLSSSSSTSSSTSSLDDIPHFILDSTTSPETQGGNDLHEKFIPPRVEIRDSAGELMQIDSLMIIDGKYVGDPDDLKLMEKLPEGTVIGDLNTPIQTPNSDVTTPTMTPSIEVAVQNKSTNSDENSKKIVNNEKLCDINSKSSLENILKYEYKKPDLKFDSKNENKINTLRSIPAPLKLQSGFVNEKPKNLKFSDNVIDKNNDYDKTPTVANPDPIIQSIQIENDLKYKNNCQNSDSETEITGPVLTETELSDWTADDAVSENFVDIEFALNSNKGTIRRNKKTKKKLLSNSITKSIPIPSMQPDSIQQLINNNSLGKHLDFDNIEFMDTGSEDSCIETYSTTNKTMLKNRGYVEFVDNHEIKDYLNYKADPSYVSNPVTNNRSPVNNYQSKIPIIEAINKDIPKIDFIEQGACILNNDNDLKTPINETQKTTINGIKTNSESLIQEINQSNDMEEDSLIMIASQATTTTEDSDALTVVTSPLDSFPSKMENLSDLDRQLNSVEDKKQNSSEIEKLLEKTINNNNSLNERFCKDINKTPDEMSYEEYVRQLQTKIREISSARDSLDMRKTRRKSSKSDEITVNNSSINNATPTKILSVFNNKIQDGSPPTVTKKLEEITKERTKQKDLIHDLVMDKLQTKKQLNAEKRLNRTRNRNNAVFSPIAVTPNVSLNPNGDICNDIHSINPERRNSKTKLETDRRHSIHLATSPLIVTKENKEKSFRPLSELHNKDTQIPSKLSKTQSFCMSTPRTNPYSEFRTPIQQSRIPIKSLKYEENLASTEKIREEARARARLKSNEDLGLSPEDKINLIRKRHHIDFVPNAGIVVKTPIINNNINKSDDMKFREKKLMGSKSVNDINTVHQLALDLRKNYIETPKSQPQTPRYSKDFIYANEHDLKNSKDISNKCSKDSKDNISKDGSHDRRKGIIQTVSDFFYKKRDSYAGKEKESSRNDLRFGLFKMTPRNKSKEKFSSISNEHSKSENCLKYDNNLSQSSSPEKLEDEAPPIPPLPLNYQRSDDENDSREINKKFRSISKASRQGELKRLRIAQEIQREQEEIEVKIKDLEACGVTFEKALRGEDFDRTDPTKKLGVNDEKLVHDLLEIWRNITELKKRDEELSIRQKELQLEHRHAQLKEELNIRLSCNKLDKSSSDIAAEGAILNEMLDIVAKRAALRPVDAIPTNSSLNDDLDSDV